MGVVVCLVVVVIILVPIIVLLVTRKCDDDPRCPASYGTLVTVRRRDAGDADVSEMLIEVCMGQCRELLWRRLVQSRLNCFAVYLQTTVSEITMFALIALLFIVYYVCITITYYTIGVF